MTTPVRTEIVTILIAGRKMKKQLHRILTHIIVSHITVIFLGAIMFQHEAYVSGEQKTKADPRAVGPINPIPEEAFSFHILYVVIQNNFPPIL